MNIYLLGILARSLEFRNLFSQHFSILQIALAICYLHISG